MIPVVTATVACFFERPIANAFGIDVRMIATFGFGRSAWTHRRSTIACSSGASFGETSSRAHRPQAELLRREELEDEQAAGDDGDQ